MFLHLILLLLLLPVVVATTLGPLGITADLNMFEISSDCDLPGQLRRHGTARVRLMEPLRDHISLFRGSGFILSLAPIVPGTVDSLAENVTNARSWIIDLGLPELDDVTIADISIGYNMTSDEGINTDWMGEGAGLASLANRTMRAMVNARQALDELGMNDIRITTELSFIGIINGVFPPTKAEFRNETVDDIQKLLQLLREWRSPFQIDIQPYEMVLTGGCDTKYALFEIDSESELAKIDPMSGFRYGNIFEVMVDAVIASMAKMGYADIEIQVASTGWPTATSYEKTASNVELADHAYYQTMASTLHAAEYVGRLSTWAVSGIFGTPLRPGVVPITYVHSMLDDNANTLQDGTIGGPKNAMGIFEYDSQNLCLTPRFYLSLNGTYDW